MPATTIEHCPPRALFQYRQWPEGFEFPACDECNHGSADQDLLIAMLARMDPFTELGNKDGKGEGLVRNVNAQFPGMIQRMLPSAVEARRSNRKLGLSPRLGQTHQQSGVVKVTPEMQEAVGVFACKLSKAIYYLDAGSAFPKQGCLLLSWFTNADLLRDGKYVAFDILKELPGQSPLLQRTGKYLNDQFEYIFSISAGKEMFVLRASFGKAFGFVVFGCTIAGRFESHIEQLREQLGKDGPRV